MRAGAAMDPLELSFPLFVALHLALLALEGLLAWLLVALARGHHRDPERGRPLSPYAVALIAGGWRRVCEAAVAKLVTSEWLVVVALGVGTNPARRWDPGDHEAHAAAAVPEAPESGDGAGSPYRRRAPVDPALAPSTALDELVLATVTRCGRNSCAGIVSATRSLQPAYVADLSRRGLVVSARAPRLTVIALAVFGAALVAVGIARCVVELAAGASGRGTGLVVLVTATVVLTLLAMGLASEHGGLPTKAGVARLAELAKTHARLKDSWPVRGDEAALWVALFGKPDDPELRDALRS